MLTRAVLAITLLSGLSFAQFPSSAQNTPSARSALNLNSQVNVTVTVRTAQGEPAANARVELRDLSMGVGSYAGYTNSAGVAEIPNVPGGSYDVVATYKLSEVQQRANLSFGDRALYLTFPTDNRGADVGSSSSVSVAAYQVPDKARKEYKKAEEALTDRKVDEARKHLDKALEIYSAYPDALALRGVIRMDSQDKEGAMNDLDAAIKVDSSCSMAYFAIGAVYNSMERFDDAIRSLNRGLTVNPKSWQAYFELGKAYVGKGEYQTGLEQLSKAQSFATVKYPPIHLVKAHAMLATRQYSGAMKELQDFLTEAPNDSRSANAKATLDKVSAFVAQGAVASK